MKNKERNEKQREKLKCNGRKTIRSMKKKLKSNEEETKKQWKRYSKSNKEETKKIRRVTIKAVVK
ncbi:hypothetical protein CJP74_05080 [Psittacicella melopsittaci]|uniref:Uncharacterized protein n=1 Tax=Psittacicella melopsittaci TaxID=2028576 RepID=A0A3A1Y1M3_9GAMM|nr:hypothetical protein [Psittacicella melopsittaci]RIY32232.1 hypothetical protein CJP74_05080 [Psittacicella melopsittaci]